MKPPLPDINHNQRSGKLGEGIRKARQGRFTVEQLAVRSGVSSGLISQIEKGRGNPSFMTLLKLASALTIPVGELVDDANSESDERLIVRKNERAKLHLEHVGLTYELLTPDFQRSLAMIRCTIPGGFDNRERALKHESEESVHVISGQIVCHVGDQEFALSAGDTITYDSRIVHTWRNPTAEPAVVISVVTPPTF